MYMLVRNIRIKVMIGGLDSDYVLFNVSSDVVGVQLLFQRAEDPQADVLIEHVEWMYVPQYLAKLRFQLDETEEFGTLEEQLKFPP